MNHINCHVICDLLPLYIDKACSRETMELVETHLQTCGACRKLFDEMKADLSASLQPPKPDNTKMFQNVCRNMIGILIALAVMINCFAVNVKGAWGGGPAEAGQMIAAVLYIIFWGIFSVVSRKYSPLVKITFVFSLLSCISAVSGLVCTLLGRGGFIAAFVSLFAAIPFYGLRMVMDWTGLYLTAAVLSACWLMYAAVNRKKLEKLF